MTPTTHELTELRSKLLNACEQTYLMDAAVPLSLCIYGPSGHRTTVGLINIGQLRLLQALTSQKDQPS